MMPYLFGLELTVPQTGRQQRERDLSMGRLAARLSLRRSRRPPGIINRPDCSR
jgi:hypothetical protein